MSKLKKTHSNKPLIKAIAFLKLDMTMEELGNRLNYSKAAVSKYLGDFPPSKNFLIKFEEEFNVKLSDFESDEENIVINRSDEKTLSENEILKELVKELRERVVDLKTALDRERGAKDFISGGHEFKEEK